MKKVVLLYFIFISAVICYGQSITGTTPATIAYVRATAFTRDAAASGKTRNSTPNPNNFVDILPLHPISGAGDRSFWKETTTNNLISIPFVINKQDLSAEVRAKGYDATMSVANVWEHNTKNTTFTDNYIVSLPANLNSYPNGTYTKQLRLRLWNVLYSNWLSTSSNVTATITMTLTITGNTTTLGLSATVINFGEVTTNETGTFTATVDSMQPYSLTMSSSNSYKLEYYNPLSSQIEPISGENIAYDVLINGKTYSTTLNPGNVATITSVTTPVSHSYPGTVTLKTVTAITGGEYKDTLTFTVTAP